MAFTRIAQPLQQQGQQLARVSDNRAVLILEVQSLDQMAEGGEAGGYQLGGRLGPDREADALEDGGLGGLGDSQVLDVGLELVELGGFLLDGDGGLLQRAQKGSRLLIHGERAARGNQTLEMWVWIELVRRLCFR